MDTNAELATLEKFAEQESDFEDLDLRLIELNGARKDWAAETKYAEHLLQINPLIPRRTALWPKPGSVPDNKDQAIDRLPQAVVARSRPIRRKRIMNLAPVAARARRRRRRGETSCASKHWRRAPLPGRAQRLLLQIEELNQTTSSCRKLCTQS